MQNYTYIWDLCTVLLGVGKSALSTQYLQAQQQNVSRRDGLRSFFASVAAASLLVKPADAAILGIEGKEEKDAEYKSFTVCVHPRIPFLDPGIFQLY